MKLRPCTGRSWGLVCSVRDTCAHHQAFSGEVNDVHEPVSPYARALCGQNVPDYQAAAPKPINVLARPALAQLSLFA